MSEFSGVDVTDLTIGREPAAQHIGAEGAEGAHPFLGDATLQRGHVSVGTGVARNSRALADNVGLEEEHHVSVRAGTERDGGHRGTRRDGGQHLGGDQLALDREGASLLEFLELPPQ